MHKLTISILFFVVFLSFSHSKTWTVDNHPGANFSSLTNAHAAASAGDTILIAGSAMPYSGATFTKQLVIIGPGYFLDENTGLQANQISAKVAASTFFTGSAGSVVMGVHFTGTVSLSTHSVKIKRCMIENTAAAVLFNNGSDSCEISQSYLENTNPSSAQATIYLNTTVNNIKINNNFIDHSGTTYYAISYSNAIHVLTGNSAIYNNVIRQHILFTGGSFYNNILREGNFNATGVTPYNNIANSTQFGTSNDNQENVNMADVFVSSGTTDSQWQIVAEGPADATGFGGADCGMFENGLNEAYILSGIPPVPAIYDFSATTDLSNITVNARANQ